jgi:nucleotide-binding universal stress UspA family protein
MANVLIRRILVPVDLSSCSRAALEFACSLAETYNASLEVLFVRVPEAGSRIAEPGVREVQLAADREELHRFIAATPGAGAVVVSERTETGDARERIVSIAENEGFDLITLGTHGRTGRPRMLAGSVAESVVRTAACPVVTVRERR